MADVYYWCNDCGDECDDPDTCNSCEGNDIDERCSTCGESVENCDGHDQGQR